MFPLDILGGKSARNWPKLISLARARRLTAVLERVAVTTPAAKREVYLIGASLKLQPACVWERGVGFLPFFFFFLIKASFMTELSSLSSLGSHNVTQRFICYFWGRFARNLRE